MKKIKINMLSSADKVDGQGVGSAYLEQVNLVKEGASDIFDIMVNANKKADIIHHHTVDPGNFVKMNGKKSINVAYVHFLPHTLDGSIQLPKFMFNIFKKYVVKFYKKADYLVVVNPIFIDDLVRYNIKREKVRYIPNYVSKEKFYEKEFSEKLKIREKYGLKKDDFVVFGAGQIQTRKGILDFIECAKKLADVTFVWAGGFSFGKISDNYEELKKIYENPPQNVKFLGIVPREDMNDLYNVADVMFLPSYNELFPMVILESANCHVPMLLRDLELYKDILFGNYMMGNNNQEFIECIKKLKTDKKVYEEYREKSKNISEYYSKEHVLEIWKSFYTEIYEKGKPAKEKKPSKKTKKSNTIKKKPTKKK